MSLSQIITEYRSKLLHTEQQSEHAIRSAHSHMLATVKPHLDMLYRQMKAAKGDEPLPLHWLSNRLPATKSLIKVSVNAFGSQAKLQVLDTQHKGAILGESSAISQLNTAAPHSGIKVVGHAEFNKFVGTSHTGKPIGDLMEGFGDEASNKTGKALISGVSMGKDPDWIDKLIMAALLISLSRALTINRTEEMSAFRIAWQLTMQQNDMQQWQWVAFPVACPFCQSMDGTVHDISEDMDSHPNCRCQQKLVVA